MAVSFGENKLWRLCCHLLLSIAVAQLIKVSTFQSTTVSAVATSPSLSSPGAPFMTMWTQGQVYVLNAGQSIELDCEFYAETFNMFKNPVVWRKYQRQELTEMNIMGNIQEPFFTTGRFAVTFSTNPPRYRMRLQVKDLSLEDSGNYSCEVRGQRANTLGSVTHYIFIRAPVQFVSLAAFNSSTASHGVRLSPSYHHIHSDGGTKGSGHLLESPTASSFDHPLLHPDIDYHPNARQSNRQTVELTFLAGVPGPLRCTASGGYPPPEIAVHIGGIGETTSTSGDEISVDVTDRLPRITHSASLVGEPGLRLMLYRTERSTDGLVLHAQDDGKTITCLASVADIGAMSATAKLVVHHAPIVRCLPASAAVNELNAFVHCIVRARPSLVSLYWQIDVNGTTVTEGAVKDDYWTLVMVQNDGVIETKLFMRRALSTSFRQYTLFAENSVAITRTDTVLSRRQIQSPPDSQSTLELYRQRHNQHQKSRNVHGFRSPGVSSSSSSIRQADQPSDFDADYNSDGHHQAVGSDVIRRMVTSTTPPLSSRAVLMTSSIVLSTLVVRRLLSTW